jgi:glutaredoxin-dependent peroxiredoxin
MAIKVGDKAPDFTLYDTEKKSRSLKEFIGKKTLLAFYPGAFTGACTKELCTFRDSLASLASLNAQIVAVSVDSPFANKGFADHNRLTFPLLSDFTRVVSKTYCGLYEGFGGLTGYTAAKRSVFVIDSNGTVKYAWISENPGVEPNYDEINKFLASM